MTRRAVSGSVWTTPRREPPPLNACLVEPKTSRTMGSKWESGLVG